MREFRTRIKPEVDYSRDVKPRPSPFIGAASVNLPTLSHVSPSKMLTTGKLIHGVKNLNNRSLQVSKGLRRASALADWRVQRPPCDRILSVR